MIGKNVTIEIFGTLAEKCLYSGQIVGGKDVRHVYVVSDQPLSGAVDCVIIASAVGETSLQTRLVAAPVHEVFYEPEIDRRLQRTSLRYRWINCIYEKSCGAVVYRINEKNEVRVLLVKNHNGKCWTFPKGHIERGETEEQTALREIKEETGLTVEIIPGFRETSTYRPFGKIHKTAVFFLAKADKSVVSMQPSEIDYYLWVSLNEALTMCRHDNDIKILNEVKRRLGVK